MPYAAETTVPIERSKTAIEMMLKLRGAEGFASAWDAHGNRIEVLWKNNRIRFLLPKVDPAKYSHTLAGRERNQKSLADAVAQADRVRWRGLHLVVKAKLEAVEAGISVFEEEFLAFIVDPKTDRTVGDVLVPRLQAGDQLLIGTGK